MLSRLSLAALIAALPALPALADPATLAIAAPFEIKAADPLLSGDIFLKLDVMETLVNSDATGALLPGLADRWSVSEDGLSWRFHIRPGVTFHDASPLTAEAAAAALTWSWKKEGILAKAPVAAITAEGEEVVITLKTAFAALPAFLAEYRTGILAPAAYGADGTVTALIGTGAFRVTVLEPPLRLEAVRFDGYWGGPAKLEAIHYAGVSRAETRALMAESGDAGLVVNLDPASVTRLASVKTVTVHSVSLPRVLLLKLNAAAPFFDTVAERRALSLAIDRAGLAQAVLRYPAAATQMFPPAAGAWHDPALAPLGYDPEAAKAAFAAAGWVPGPDGILQHDGQPFAVELLTYPDRPELPLTAAVLDQMLREVGIAVTINSTNSSEIPAKHAAGTLQMALFARNFALVPDPIGTLMQDYAPTGDWGAMGWDNPAFTAAVRKIAAEGGTAAEKAALSATLQADLPVVPIAWYQQTAAVSNSVKGIVIDPYERTFGLKSAEIVQ
ncbi:ABC transporter substrate-binding protein [Rhodobacter capsulatus]|uniref:ABC transporter substrate-binding protein n=1 Tax=Rhodobacter capsulatus TaxID=1061 RepID=UPI0006DD044B|nr:ABC transporter substrate-binding protein [Rhodobacter capsulatus]KQB13222.1 ABC transporter substrate-binding protein [Rhodobacter capsulatus]KQB13769.1 ABC transporter substrate-binding protein [Rhodobacter capsulatus]PZX21390.1 peptide/nickel transport system substrate-binding protein [Rhodobacter capsulatus]QNR62122.1 ABC transporter substrate-binding protein [Rhodobacter capsulatus]